MSRGYIARRKTTSGASPNPLAGDRRELVEGPRWLVQLSGEIAQLEGIGVQLRPIAVQLGRDLDQLGPIVLQLGPVGLQLRGDLDELRGDVLQLGADGVQLGRDLDQGCRELDQLGSELLPIRGDVLQLARELDQLGEELDQLARPLVHIAAASGGNRPELLEELATFASRTGDFALTRGVLDGCWPAGAGFLPHGLQVVRNTSPIPGDRAEGRGLS